MRKLAVKYFHSLKGFAFFAQLFGFLSSTQSGTNSKLVEYLNEMLSVENAAIDRIQSRIEECPIQEAKSKLQQHLEETRGQ